MMRPLIHAWNKALLLHQRPRPDWMRRIGRSTQKGQRYGASHTVRAIYAGIANCQRVLFAKKPAPFLTDAFRSVLRQISAAEHSLPEIVSLERSRNFQLQHRVCFIPEDILHDLEGCAGFGQAVCLHQPGAAPDEFCLDQHTDSSVFNNTDSGDKNFLPI